jgi:hypothetical protein
MERMELKDRKEPQAPLERREPQALLDRREA